VTFLLLDNARVKLLGVSARDFKLMGFILLIFQSIFGLSFFKVSLAYVVLETILFITSTGNISTLLIRSVLFFIFSFLINRFSDSIVKWVIVLISAGFIFA